MYTVNDTYICYRQAQARAYNRPYRIPKDIDGHINKLSKGRKDGLEKLTKLFNTAYRHINMDMYFDCGFQIFPKSFSYHKFVNDKIMNLYMIKDKNLKRDIDLSKESIVKSIKFIIRWIGDRRNKTVSLLIQYCSMYENGTLAPIYHYNMMNIDKYFITWLLKEKYLRYNQSMSNEIPMIINNYRSLSYELNSINEFLNNIKEKLKEK